MTSTTATVATLPPIGDEPGSPARSDGLHHDTEQEGQDQRREERQAQPDDAGRDVGEAP